MSYGEPVCIFCGHAVESHVDERLHGVERLSEDEIVGRACDDCVEDVLDGLPAGDDCVECGSTAEYAHVPLVFTRTAEGEVPSIVRDGSPTPVLCAEHFGELTESR
ncbi:MAG: hypothetical protein ABEK02_04130 [Haloquadratum sp.]